MKKIICLFLLSLTIFINSFSQERIKMTRNSGGTYTIPCEVNGLKLNFIFDTGASDVSLSLLEATFMLKNGYINSDDFIGTQNYSIANGDVEENAIINLKTIKIGNKIIKNVHACVSSNIDAPLLLGQSALSELGDYTISGDYLVFNNGNISNNNDNTNTPVLQNSNNSYISNLIRKAEAGDAQAQYRLGQCYENGEKTQQDFTEAVKWLRKAAEQGVSNAQLDLGFCYENGEGVNQSYEDAVYWYRKAAEQGNKIGQWDLGQCYYYGRGVSKNYSAAAKWTRKAAEQGDAMSQCFLGFFYEKGYGVQQSYTAAVKWYRKAAEINDMWGQYYLGNCFEIGKGVSKNKKEAIIWYRKAAEQGCDKAKEAIDRLGEDY